MSLDQADLARRAFPSTQHWLYFPMTERDWSGAFHDWIGSTAPSCRVGSLEVRSWARRTHGCQTGVVSRPLSDRERRVLDRLLTVEFEGVDQLRQEATNAVVVGGCDCGCPSINFRRQAGAGMHIRVNARVRGAPGGLFLYTVDEHLGGLDWVSNSEDDDPAELPDPSVLIVSPAE